MCKNSQQHSFDNTLELVSKHWHWQRQHQIWWKLPTEAWTACSSCHIRWWNTGRVFSFWQGLRMEKIPGVFWLIEPATSSQWHTILPTDIRFTRMQNPTDSGSRTPSPIQNILLWLHLEKAIKAWVKKWTNVRSGEMHRADMFPYHRALNSNTAQGINNISSVATHAWRACGNSNLQNIHHVAGQTYPLAIHWNPFSFCFSSR